MRKFECSFLILNLTHTHIMLLYFSSTQAFNPNFILLIVYISKKILSCRWYFFNDFKIIPSSNGSLNCFKHVEYTLVFYIQYFIEKPCVSHYHTYHLTFSNTKTLQKYRKRCQNTTIYETLPKYTLLNFVTTSSDIVTLSYISCIN